MRDMTAEEIADKIVFDAEIPTSIGSDIDIARVHKGIIDAIRKVEKAARIAERERCAKMVKYAGEDEDDLVKAARRKSDHRDAAIHSYAVGTLQTLVVAIRALADTEKGEG